jgi:hypothetical protein
MLEVFKQHEYLEGEPLEQRRGNAERSVPVHSRDSKEVLLLQWR